MVLRFRRRTLKRPKVRAPWLRLCRAAPFVPHSQIEAAGAFLTPAGATRLVFVVELHFEHGCQGEEARAELHFLGVILSPGPSGFPAEKRSKRSSAFLCVS